ncbi:6-carboxytetrahydropterin synthase [Actinosynnema sp. NPDC050436]|uniref:6-pyruvoyl trahydropterin synthase family protein n=1 Tax=Actinosynnema sp. NPDC050436 TaxID=3155659 RepID=UPI0033FE1EEB
MAHKVTVVHSFEAGHRLPHVDGKCVSLHGHSWSVAVTVSAPKLGPEVTVVEFGALKVGLRRWIDGHLDHATMLGACDRLVEPLVAEGSRVLRFGAERPEDVAEQLACGLPWPTVEAVAVLLGRVAESVMAGLPRADGARVEQVLVRETRLNTAVYEPTVPR